MSYKVQRTMFTLVFNDPEHEGIVVRVRATSFGERMRIWHDLSPTQDDTLEVRKTKMDELHALFVDHLVDWNLVEEDDTETPIPATVAGLHSLEPEFVGTIIGVWQMGRAAVPAPLGQPSTGGEPSQVESALMALPTESLAS
jgi:hypothetical protein